jgi:hypothetical protein
VRRDWEENGIVVVGFALEANDIVVVGFGKETGIAVEAASEEDSVSDRNKVLGFVLRFRRSKDVGSAS